MLEEIDEETDLIKIALLPDSIPGRAKDVIARLEELIKGKDTGGGGGRTRVKKIKLFPSPKRIKTLTEWTGLKDELDAQISTALDQGDEVELS